MGARGCVAGSGNCAKSRGGPDHGLEAPGEVRVFVGDIHMVRSVVGVADVGPPLRRTTGLVPDRLRGAPSAAVWFAVTMKGGWGLLRSCVAEADVLSRRPVRKTDCKEVMSSPLADGPAEEKLRSPFAVAAVEEYVTSL